MKLPHKAFLPGMVWVVIV